MLALSRKQDESIIIGDDIEIVVIDIRRGKVRLGIKAPRHISVHRKEVHDAIKAIGQEAEVPSVEFTTEPGSATEKPGVLVIQKPDKYFDDSDDMPAPGCPGLGDD